MAKPRSKFKKIKWFFGKEIKIPKEWNLEKLEENSTIKGRIGWQGLTTAEYLKTGDYYLVTGTDFKNGKIDWRNCVYVDDIRYAQDQNIQLKNEDVLVTKDGTIGKIAYVSTMAKPATLNSGIFVIRPISKKYSSLFLFYVLNSFYFLKFLSSLQAGSTINHLYQKNFVNFQFPLPNVSEQQKIASILSGVDALIESTQKTIEKTEMFKKGLMQKLLTKGINHIKFKKVKWLFGKEIEIPEEWKLERLGNICKIRKSSNISSDLYIGLEHIGQGNNLIESTGNVNEFTSTKNTFSQGDVLYGKLRPLLNKVWLATESGYCSTDILPLVPTNKILSQILLFVLTNHDFLWYAVGTSAGTKMPRTSWSDMKKFPVVLSNIQEQQKIASILSGVDAYIQKNQQYKEKLEKLKKGLMQKLLTGQIRIKA